MKVKIPEGVDTIQVTSYGDKIVVEMVRGAVDFLSKVTREKETRAEEGDFAILWDSGKEWAAVATYLKERNYEAFSEIVCPYKGANEVWYENAIRFRDNDQFKKIINYKQNVEE